MKVFSGHFWLCIIVKIGVYIFFERFKGVITVYSCFSFGGAPILQLDPISLAVVLRIHLEDVTCTFYNFS